MRDYKEYPEPPQRNKIVNVIMCRMFRRRRGETVSGTLRPPASCHPELDRMIIKAVNGF